MDAGALMKRNRKHTETYRFNGYPHRDPGSIHSVGIARLEEGVREYESKLASATDPDDKKWVKRWLDRYRAELAKKRKGLELKRRSRAKLGGGR